MHSQTLSFLSLLKFQRLHLFLHQSKVFRKTHLDSLYLLHHDVEIKPIPLNQLMFQIKSPNLACFNFLLKYFNLVILLISLLDKRLHIMVKATLEYSLKLNHKIRLTLFTFFHLSIQKHQ